MSIESIQPQGWAKPRGYVNGVALSGAARLVFIAGQIAWDAEQRLVGGDDFVAQFRQALGNVVDVVRAAGGKPTHIVSLTVYVTDKKHYASSVKRVGEVWRELVGRHYPAMALVEVSDLLEEGAQVEIQGIAALD